MIEIWGMLWIGELTRKRYTFFALGLPLINRTNLTPVKPGFLIYLSTEALGRSNGEIHGKVIMWFPPRLTFSL